MKDLEKTIEYHLTLLIRDGWLDQAAYRIEIYKKMDYDMSKMYELLEHYKKDNR